MKRRRAKSDFGERLLRARRAKGLTQALLAKLTGENIRSIGRWERGESRPSVDRLNKLELALETRLTEGPGVDAPGAQEALALIARIQHDLSRLRLLVMRKGEDGN